MWYGWVGEKIYAYSQEIKRARKTTPQVEVVVV